MYSNTFRMLKKENKILMDKISQNLPTIKRFLFLLLCLLKPDQQTNRQNIQLIDYN